MTSALRKPNQIGGPWLPGEERNASDGIYDDSLLMRIEEASDGNAGRFNFVLDLA